MFWWILYYDTVIQSQMNTVILVSILVLVDLILWLNSSFSISCSTIVSILVLVDLILWRLWFLFLIILFQCFNPCFGGSYIMTLFLFQTEKYFLVSILVLVDLILWLYQGKKYKCLDGGFNPCFGGSYIMTVWDIAG